MGSKSVALMDIFSRIKASALSRYLGWKIRLRASLKEVRKRVVNLGPPRSVIFVFGCQRSGTTFLERLFRDDNDSVVFGEFSELSISPDKTVLRNNASIAYLVMRSNATYAIIRNLFESDRSAELLGIFPQAHAVWVFRRVEEVVASMVVKWGDDFFDISRRVESNGDGHWRLESQLSTIKERAATLPDGDHTCNCYALYWLHRNQLPWKSTLAVDSRVTFIDYRQLLGSQTESLGQIFDAAGVAHPAMELHDFTPRKPRSGNRRRVNISAELLRECEDLYSRLTELAKGKKEG